MPRQVPPNFGKKESIPENQKTWEDVFPNMLKLVPDRICGDIPFANYRSAFATPKKYLEFLKQLRESSSRHDFLFWLFDIIAGGRGENLLQHNISVAELEELMRSRYRYAFRIVRNCAIVTCFSEYLIKTYPTIILPNNVNVNAEKIRGDTTLFTFPNSKELYRYRRKAFKKLKRADLVRVNHDVTFFVDPMHGLTSNDIPEPPVEVSYEGYEASKARKQSFFTFYNYFWKLSTFTGRIPGSSDCILAQKDVYKRLQVEKVMKKIDVQKLVPANLQGLIKCAELDSIVVVAVAETTEDSVVVVEEKFKVARFADVDEDGAHGSSHYIRNIDAKVTVDKFIEDARKYNYKRFPRSTVFKRAKVLSFGDDEKEVTVLFVDYGEVADVSIKDVYNYEFNERVPPLLTTVVPEDRLGKTLQINDLYFFGFLKQKYVYVGHPTEYFNPAPNPLHYRDTDTESVDFGPESPDWENEEFEDENEKLPDAASAKESYLKFEQDDELIVFGVEKPWASEEHENEFHRSYSANVSYNEQPNYYGRNESGEEDFYEVDHGSVGSRSD